MRGVFIAGLCGLAHGWWDGGHTLAVAIAARHLKLAGKGALVDKIDNMLLREKTVWDNYSSIPRVGTWADKIKLKAPATEGERFDQNALFSNVHFIDQPIRLYKKEETELESDTWGNLQESLFNNVTYVTAYSIMRDAIANVIAPEGQKFEDMRGTLWSQDLAVRLIVHLAADLHMPLHGVGLFHPALCGLPDDTEEVCHENDAGGNGIGLDWTRVTKYDHMAASINLHGLWDSMCYYAEWGTLDFTDEEIDEAAETLMTDYPLEYFTGKEIGIEWDSLEVLYEDLILATVGREEDRDIMLGDGEDRARIYPDSLIERNIESSDPFEKKLILQLTDEYIDWCQNVSKQRVALAGYRLSTLLEKIANSRVDSLQYQLPETCKDSAASSFTLGGLGAALALAILRA